VVDAPGTGGQAASLPLAGFWIRFFGLLVDGILFAIVNLLLSALFLSTTTTTVGGIQITVSTGPRLLIDAILLVVELAYCTWFWTNRGATLGQMLVGIRVVDADTGQLLKPSQAVVRYLGYIISGIPLLLGYIWAAFDPRKQGWAPAAPTVGSAGWGVHPSGQCQAAGRHGERPSPQAAALVGGALRPGRVSCGAGRITTSPSAGSGPSFRSAFWAVR